MRVGYLCGLDSGIYVPLKDFGGSWEHKSSEMLTPCVWTWILTTFGCLLFHQYTYDCNVCETEHVWGTCMDLIPAYLHDSRTLVEVESIKPVKCRVLLYICEFQRFLGAYVYTSTHMMAVVVRQNMCGVPVWTWFRHISIITALLRKLKAWRWFKTGTQPWSPLSGRCLLLQKYTYAGRGCETECVWGICMDLTSPYLCDSSRLTADTHAKYVKCYVLSGQWCRVQGLGFRLYSLPPPNLRLSDFVFSTYLFGNAFQSSTVIKSHVWMFVGI